MVNNFDVVGGRTRMVLDLSDRKVIYIPLTAEEAEALGAECMCPTIKIAIMKPLPKLVELNKLWNIGWYELGGGYHGEISNYEMHLTPMEDGRWSCYCQECSVVTETWKDAVLMGRKNLKKYLQEIVDRL